MFALGVFNNASADPPTLMPLCPADWQGWIFAEDAMEEFRIYDAKTVATVGVSSPDVRLEITFPPSICMRSGAEDCSVVHKNPVDPEGQRDLAVLLAPRGGAYTAVYLGRNYRTIIVYGLEFASLFEDEKGQVKELKAGCYRLTPAD